jgi:hypothetical protein
MATNIINDAMEHGRKAKTDGKQKLEVKFVFHTFADFLDERFIVLEPGPSEILKKLMTGRESCQFIKKI